MPFGRAIGLLQPRPASRRSPQALRYAVQTGSAAARVRGLPVTNTPDAPTDYAADFAFMLALCSCRHASEYERIMREGWRRGFGLPDMPRPMPSGERFGLVAMGRIGRAVTKQARGFDARTSGRLSAAGLNAFRT